MRPRNAAGTWLSDWDEEEHALDIQRPKPEFPLNFRQLVRAFGLLFAGGVVLGVLFIAEVGRKHGESLWLLTAVALELATIQATVGFVLMLVPLWRRAREIADVVHCHGIKENYRKGVFRYTLEMPVGGDPRTFLRESETFARDTFTIREVRWWEHNTGFTADAPPFVGILRHRLDVSIGSRSDGYSVAWLATESVSRLPIAPPIDAGGVAMLVYLAHWMHGSPLPVVKGLGRTLKGDSTFWQAVVATID